MDSLNRSIAGWLCLFSGQYLILMLGYKYEGLFFQAMALGFFGTNVIVSYKRWKQSKKEKKDLEKNL